MPRASEKGGKKIKSIRNGFQVKRQTNRQNLRKQQFQQKEIKGKEKSFLKFNRQQNPERDNAVTAR